MLISVAEKLVDAYFACLPRPRPAQHALESTRIIAHRGAHNPLDKIIENTDLAFQKARSLGCWGIEFDVHATKDGVLVVHHDACLTRLWKDRHEIKNLTFEELRQLTPDIPSLGEVVEKYGFDLHLFIELKTTILEKTLLDTLQRLKPCEHYHLLSLKESLFNPLQKTPKESLLLVAGFNNTSRYCQLSITKGYGGVMGHYLLLDKGLAAQLKKAHQQVGVGFVDSRFSLYREINRGIPWIFSNNVEKVCRYIASEG